MALHVLSLSILINNKLALSMAFDLNVKNIYSLYLVIIFYFMVAWCIKSYIHFVFIFVVLLKLCFLHLGLIECTKYQHICQNCVFYYKYISLYLNHLKVDKVQGLCKGIMIKKRFVKKLVCGNEKI